MGFHTVKDLYVQDQIRLWYLNDVIRAQEEADELGLEVARRRAKLEAMLKQADKAKKRQ